MTNINTSSLDFQKEIEKKLFERQFSTKHNFEIMKTLNNNKGEITNVKMDINDHERGMPMRSDIEFFKKKNTLSERNDFDLFDNEQPLNINFNYNDDFNMPVSNINENNISNLNNNETVKIIMNEFSCEFYKYINEYIDSNFVVSPLTIFLFFSFIYYCAKNDTENILKNLFMFPNKNILIMELNDILNNININLVNVILINKKININPKLFEQFTKSYRFGQIGDNKKKLIAWIKKNVNINIPDSIIKNALMSNIGYVNLNCNIIGNFKSIGKKIFYSKKNYKIDMMKGENIICMLYNDNSATLIEFITDSDLIIGIILPSYSKKFELSYKKLNFMVGNSKPTIVKTLYIPKINMHQKIKLDSLIKGLKLIGLYENMDLLELTNNKIKLTGIIHDISVNINFKKKNQKKINGVKIDKINIDHNFMYYVKDKINNLILVVGQI